MESDFWHQRWINGEIAFHEDEANSLLTNNIESLGLVKGNTFFLPLCGKTRDIAWLLSLGYKVVGAELSKIAIDALFEDLAMSPTITEQGELTQYDAQGITIFVGDLFSLTAKMVGTVNAVYDRAALVALPKAMRNQYSAHVIDITHSAAQLLITFEYDQQLMDGPPFSINEAEVKHHYAQHYQTIMLERCEVVGGLKKKAPATESAWHLNPL